MQDKLTGRALRDVFHGDTHRSSVRRNRKANDLDNLSFAFIGLFNRLLVNPLNRYLGVAEITFERRLRSIELRRIALPSWIGKAEGIPVQLQRYNQRVLGSVQALGDPPRTRNCMCSVDCALCLVGANPAIYIRIPFHGDNTGSNRVWDASSR